MTKRLHKIVNIEYQTDPYSKCEPEFIEKSLYLVDINIMIGLDSSK